MANQAYLERLEALLRAAVSWRVMRLRGGEVLDPSEVELRDAILAALKAREGEPVSRG